MDDVIIKESLVAPYEYGLFANREFKETEYIGHMRGVRVHEVIDPTHVLWVGNDCEIPLLIENEFRYMNHDSDPNCHLDGLVVYAMRDIEKGEELTWDYGEEFQSQLDNEED